ncbi:hypothetical protein C8J57DRAFT_1437578 [Mycena rebaudengoi]|nr:hypothetical protein C8J57DRAFT_1437578 [Mycena rebaudengoi]
MLLFGSNWLQKIAAVDSASGSGAMSLFGVFCVLCSEPETSAGPTRFKAAVGVTHTEPVEVQDEHGNICCFCLYVNAGPSDTPMQSKVSAHIGGKGNCFCRKCLVGGTQKEKATNEGYHALFEAGVPCSKDQILQELERQVKLACSGVIKHVKDSQTRTGVKDTYTQFWIDQLISRFKEMKKNDPDRSVQDVQKELIQWTIDNREKIYSCFDPTKDTPIDSYNFAQGRQIYLACYPHSVVPRAEADVCHSPPITNTDGLSIHAIRSTYIMQYAGSLTGRLLVNLPRSSDLKIAVANVLDVFATIDPSKIIAKIKYHLLVHTDEDVVQFGPLIGVATEVFESFNGVFRYCSILSIHLAPSRDIAQQLGDQEGLKHRITRGCGVRHFMAEHPVLQKLVGWAEEKIVKHAGTKERESYPLKSTTAVRALNYGLYDPDSTWRKCLHVFSESLDECRVDSWVFAKSPMAEDILMDPSRGILVVLELFQFLSSRDEIYGIPVLVRRDSEVTFVIVPAKNIKFLFNVQHDCHFSKCEATGIRIRMQERVASDKTENYIVHRALDRFFINTHAFHNAHLLRATLPRDLISPVLLFPDRQAKHHALATELRSMVANRSRRAIKRTKRAMAADEEDSTEEVEGDSDDSEEGYINDSDGEYSD